jgi:hypothetical protein
MPEALTGIRGRAGFSAIARAEIGGLGCSRHRQELSGLLGGDGYGKVEVFVTHGGHSN